jgi:hypothetical protein
MAQVLCYEACLQGKVFETQAGLERATIRCKPPTIREVVLQDFDLAFSLQPLVAPPATDFAGATRAPDQRQ